MNFVGGFLFGWLVLFFLASSEGDAKNRECRVEHRALECRLEYVPVKMPRWTTRPTQL